MYSVMNASYKETMKRVIAGICLALCIAMSTSLSAGAISILHPTSGTCGKKGSELTWELDSNGVLTIQGTGAMKDYEYFPMTTPWGERDEIKKLVISEGVTSIGQYAFYFCTSLSEVSLPNTLEYLGASAFEGCSALKTVVIPNSVTDINDHAFARCTSLEFVDLPDHLDRIQLSTFYKCEALKMIDIPQSVTTIDEYAFLCCYSLENLDLPDNLRRIGGRAFLNCTNLKSLTIPATVNSVGIDPFGKDETETGYQVKSDFTAYGERGSFIEGYCREEGIEFKPINSPATLIKLPRSVISISVVGMTTAAILLLVFSSRKRRKRPNLARFCGYCGNPLSENVSRCPFCGKSIKR